MTRQPTGSNTRLRRGIEAEHIAARYLEARGLRVVARNVRCRAGELDLVCLDGNILVVVEVRLRVRLDFGGALGSVTWRKQQKIIRATRFLMQREPWRTYVVRFDVLALQGLPGAQEVVWIKDAFRT